MTLGYFAADTLGVTLYQMRGQLIANEVHQTTLGPWQLDLPIEVDSDIISGVEIGFWVTVGRTLSLYVVVREKENWLFVLNREALAQAERDTRFAATKVVERLKEIKPAIKGVFRWRNDAWTPVEYDGDAHGRVHARDLVQDSTVQGAAQSVARAPVGGEPAGVRRQ